MVSLVAPRLKDLLHFRGQILCALVVERDVAVPADAKARGAGDLLLREVIVEEEFHEVLDIDVGMNSSLGLRQHDVARQARRQGEDHVPRGSRAFHLRRRTSLISRICKAGSAMRRLIRINGERGEHREDLLAKVFVQVGALSRRELLRPQAADAILPQGREQLFVEDGVLLRDEGLARAHGHP